MKLREYLLSNGTKISFFASKAGVSLGTIHNVMSGKEPTLRVALKIENATLGAVTCKDMLPTNETEEPKERLPGSRKAGRPRLENRVKNRLSKYCPNKSTDYEKGKKSEG